MYFYWMCKRKPERAKNMILDGVRAELGPDYDIETHFTPRYNPWDQRLCLAPNGDLFDSISEGRTTIVTDEIETFTETGVKLRSGRELEADLVVTATGLNLQVMGGAEIDVDGQSADPATTLSYKGAIYSDVPNLAAVFGYTNASWTLKADLICGYVCRLLNYMEKHGYASARRATPIRTSSVCRPSISPRAISSGRWTSCRNKDRASLGGSIRTMCATSSPCGSRPSTTACWNSRRVPRSQRGLRRRRLPGLCKAQERPDGGAQSTHTLSGIPPLGWSVTRAIGVGSWPATGSKLADCSRVASMAVASIIANAMPMQMRGPAPNGRYW